MKLLPLILIISITVFTNCNSKSPEKNLHKNRPQNTVDAHSYSNVDEIRTEHLHLDLDVNFENKTIYGVARHVMSDNNVDTAIFDIKELDISRVTIGKETETETDFVIGEPDEILGRPLSVKIEPGTKYINIYYQTTDETEALDWLPPELTSGKKRPFVYTQGQAILTRSWIPLQDTPLNRISYSADVKVPNDLLALMSATNPKIKSKDGKYHFEMNQKIPSYLIALAVGDITYTELSSNTGIYSEPELADACAYEFVDLPKMVTAAEKLYGKYRWEQFDIIILPYSFPFGGMENPRLTFANPTLIAGDRSLVAVIAHELAHSWSGNLVTNATWDDFWLNEGFTVYFETRIMEELYGKEVADIHAVIQRQELDIALDDMENGNHPEDTHLKLHLQDRNPDDGMTDIAYNKGAYFLRTIEATVGREKFDQFLMKYFNSHAFETVTTEDFIKYLEENLFVPNNIEFNTEEWVYQPGIPENCVVIVSDRLQKMDELAQKVNHGKNIFSGKYANMQRSDATTQEWQAFIRALSPNLEPEHLAQLDHQLKFSEEANPVLKSEWFQLCIKVGYEDAKPYIEQHLKKIGRRWLIEGIYKELAESNQDNLAWAREVFEEAKLNYHYISKSTVQEILYPES